jgi:multicomponent Na+:H+ antiporter subunit C
METLMAIVIGVLFASGIYLMLRRSIVKLAIGLVLMSQSANLLIFTAAGLTRGNPPLVPEGESSPPIPFADPLPQALVLTAIVIGFGVLAFTLVLVKRVYQTVGTDDMDEMRSTDGFKD